MVKIRAERERDQAFGGTRSSLGDAEHLFPRLTNGSATYSEQRHDMVNTMCVDAKLLRQKVAARQRMVRRTSCRSQD